MKYKAGQKLQTKRQNVAIYSPLTLLVGPDCIVRYLHLLIKTFLAVLLDLYIGYNEDKTERGFKGSSDRQRKSFQQRFINFILIVYLLILVGRHGNELRLLEDVRPEGGVGQLHDVASSHQVEPRLVLVH